MTAEKRCLIGAAVMVASVIYGSPAFCEFIVVSSQSETLKVGTEIPDAAVIEIGKDEQLRLMDKNTGETRILIGPYKGAIANYSSSPKIERRRSFGAVRSSSPNTTLPESSRDQ